MITIFKPFTTGASFNRDGSVTPKVEEKPFARPLDPLARATAVKRFSTSPEMEAINRRFWADAQTVRGKYLLPDSPRPAVKPEIKPE